MAYKRYPIPPAFISKLSPNLFFTLSIAWYNAISSRVSWNKSIWWQPGISWVNRTLIRRISWRRSQSWSKRDFTSFSNKPSAFVFRNRFFELFQANKLGFGYFLPVIVAHIIASYFLNIY